MCGHGITFLRSGIYWIDLFQKNEIQQREMMKRFHLYQFSSFAFYMVYEINMHIVAGLHYDAFGSKAVQ